MDGPRTPRPDEFPQVMSFFQSQLRADKSWTIEDEYPLAMNANNRENVHVIEDQGQYLSGAVVKTSLIKSPAGLFKVAGIGSVVTDPRYRNQGLSRAILDSALLSAQKSACDVAILWTHLHDFYRKIGFELAGSEVSIRVEKPFDVSQHGLKVIESAKVAAEAILKLYAQHTSGTLRSVEDIRKCLAIPNMRVFTAWDSQNQIQAYAIEGKGADLTDHIHEWGGPVSKLLPLISEIVRMKGRPITVLAPAHSKNLIRQLTDHGATSHHGVLGMIKILNPDLLAAKIRRYARTMGIEQLVFESRQGHMHFGVAEHIYRTDNMADVVRLVFGPTPANELHSFDESTLKALNKLFPIPFWIWGWDSV